MPASIFIVEDEAIVANDIKETLKSLGYAISGMARTGEVALEKVPESRPDLILMDIHLAGEMDGIETAGKIGVLYNIPVIYLTAYADKSLLDRAKITEPYGYVIKPYDERELHSVIEMALYKHRIESEIKKRDAILFAVSSAVEWLLRVSAADRTGSTGGSQDLASTDIENVLDPLGLALDAGSIGIFRISTDPSGTRTFTMVYEWGCRGYPSHRFRPELQNTGFATRGLSRWEESLARGEVISAMESTIAEEERGFFRLLGVKSGVILPIFVRDTFWGFVAFFDMGEKQRSQEEIEALRITANLLGAALGYR